MAKNITLLGAEYSDVPFVNLPQTGGGLATQAATTITPGTTPQTIPAETYLTGAVTVAGDANLVGSNIVANHSIFGVEGEVELVSVTQDPVTKGLTIS